MSEKPTETPQTKAIALKKALQDDVTRVKATGKGYLAEKILDIAFEKGVPVRKDRALTDILAQLELESPIPLEAIEAVSEIFRHLYLLDQKRDFGDIDDPIDHKQATPNMPEGQEVLPPKSTLKQIKR